MALFVWMIIIAVNVTLHNNIFHSNSYIILICVMCLWSGLVVDIRYICIFIFLNKTTNGGSENNLVYSNARELIVQNRKKRYNTSQKGLRNEK
jgi:nitrogen fixation protein FixH